MRGMYAFIRRCFVLLMVAGSVFYCPAVTATTLSKGIAEVDYSGFFGPGKQVRRQAIDEAAFNAIERYVANNTQSRVKLLEKKRSEINAQRDKLLLDVKVVDEDINKKLKRLRVVVRAEINTNLLETLLSENGKVAGKGSYMTFVFVARQQSSIVRYEDSKKAFKETKKIESGADLQSGGEDGVEYTADKTTRTSMEVGSRTRSQADKIDYEVSTTVEINTAMNNVFTEAGFEVVDAQYLEGESGGQISIDAFKRDFGSGDDINSSTLSSAVAGLRALNIPYFAIGTLDVGLRDKDPVTGLVRVYVSVTGQVKSLKRRFPETVASVGPVQYAGLGPNQTVARNNALKLAAEKAAAHLTGQLNEKNIH